MSTIEESISRAKNGDESAVNWLVHHSYRKIYHIAYRFMADYDKAMDVTQKTFILMHRKINLLNDHSKYQSWLYQIAVNACREELRREKRSKVIPFMRVNPQQVQKISEDTVDEINQPETNFGKNESQKLVLKALNEINPEQKEVLILKEFEGLKFREIAEMLDISENTVKSRLYYGLKALRKTFEKWNIDKEQISYGI